MKTLTVTKNILKLFIKLASIILTVYTLIVCFTKAAYMSAFTAQDIAVFALCVFGIITLCMVEYILNFLCITLRRMRSAGNYYYQPSRKGYTERKPVHAKNKQVYAFKNGEAA